MNINIHDVGLIVVGAVVSALATIMLVNGTHWWRVLKRTNKPLFSTDTRDKAEKALIRAEDIFIQAINHGGALTYPWRSRGEEVLLVHLQDAIRSARAAIPKRKFGKNLDEVNKQIFEVWHARPVIRPRPIRIGREKYEDPAKKQREYVRQQKLADLQLSAAESGLSAVVSARSILDKLSRNI